MVEYKFTMDKVITDPCDCPCYNEKYTLCQLTEDQCDRNNCPLKRRMMHGTVTLGSRLKWLREHKRGYMSCAALAEEIGIAPLTVRNHEAGRCVPHPNIIGLYTEFYGISFHQLVQDVDPKTYEQRNKMYKKAREKQ